MYVTKQPVQPTLSERDRPAITPAMIEAGVERLGELTEAGTSSAYVVEEIYRAMKARDHHVASCAAAL